MSWNPGPDKIKGITPIDINKADILSMESWERVGGPDRRDQAGSQPTQQVSIPYSKYVCGSLLLIQKKGGSGLLTSKGS